ncbi:peptidase M20 [Desulfarculus baarsii DSM 2075]|uniref:Peptidase M20 n=1 Tax=Desulfarculus baarsii (strain ATCC 33931 / DSM 2075 / LMG 7858 / VKM B-1802 / 2st14) TaxID=644282 RepID=E1QEF8_DESB2|nr:M20 family metallopeptidase [Desulfarculus baarsii]ADK83944.1 peptidase M20 [Desulfarculus baarsii DSM 2075]
MAAPIPTPLTIAQELVRRPSREEQGEQACADYLRGLLEAAGFAVRAIDLAPGRPNLIATLPQAKPGPALAFSGHLDTVALGQAPWSFEPCGGLVDGGRLLGRGASDMKAGVAAMVHAALRLAQGPAPRPNVALIFSAGEEHGLKGALHLAKTPGALPPVGAMLIGEPTANQPLLGHKGGLWLGVEFTGKSAHASMPHLGDNAIDKAAAAIVALGGHRFAQSHAVLGRPTLNVGLIRGGAAANIVADHCRLDLDTRLLPGMDPEAVIAELRRVMGPQARVVSRNYLPPTWTEPDHPWVAAALKLIAAQTGDRRPPGGAPYVTDASALGPALGCPTLIIGPGEPGQAHQTDEWCQCERIDQAAEIYHQLALAWPMD